MRCQGHILPATYWNNVTEYYTHAPRVDRKTTIKNAIPGYATRDGHMTWSRDGHMTKVPDCSKLKNKNTMKNKKKTYVAM